MVFELRRVRQEEGRAIAKLMRNVAILAAGLVGRSLGEGGGCRLLCRFRSIRRSEETHRMMHREFAVLQLCAIQKLKMAARVSCSNDGSTGLLDIV